MSSGGGGGSTNTQSTVQTVKIPDFLQSATLDAVNAAEAIGQVPYQNYTGQTIAGLTPDQLQAIQQGSANATNPNYGTTAGNAVAATQAVPGMVNPTYDAATGMALGSTAQAAPLYGAAAGSAASIPGQVAPLYGAGAATVAGASNPGALVDNGAVMNTGDVAQWMSPYIMQALQPQLTAIQRNQVANQKNINANAMGAGAFGDARTGVESGINDRNAMESMSNAVGTGYQNAYSSALTAAQQVAAQRQALTGQRLSANQQQQTAGVDLAQIASQQGATNLTAANQTGTLNAQDYALQQQQAQDLMAYGKTQQDQTQASLSQAYQDFVNQREFPKENLNVLLSAIQGVPYSTTRLTTTPYNSTAANLGALASVVGLGGKLASSTT